MIGKIVIGKSFRGCIAYCLEDKKLSTEKALTGHRAEVLRYNLCFGNKKELTEQFRDVRKLNSRLSKPVLHITLSLAKGEKVDRHILQGIVEDCAKHIGFDKNQYLAVKHKDTAHQPLHIVANRIGFDGRTLSDSNSYKNIADFCRQAELKYRLQQVLSPKRFLPKELKQLPRSDSRKQKLKTDIIDALFKAKSFAQFESLIKAKGYRIERGRGIAFIDQKGVRIKGSEVDYSLSKIGKILGLKEQKIRINEFNRQRPRHLTNEQLAESNNLYLQPRNVIEEISHTLLQVEQQPNVIPLELIAKRKKRKQRHSRRL